MDSGGVILEPSIAGQKLCGLVHCPDDRLILYIGDEGPAIKLVVPEVRRLFAFTNKAVGSVFSSRSILFEATYGPVTEETVFTVREAYEDRDAWDETLARDIRACSFALDWWSSYGTDGVAVGEAAPDDLIWMPWLD
jgi:hypothetical protein